MKQYIPLISAAALLTLSACGEKEPEVVGGTVSAADEDDANNAAPVALPPMVKSSHTYRCKDGGLIFVDFMSDDKTVNVKTDKEGAPTVLKAEEVGKPFKAEGGFELTGSGDHVTATLPGKGAQSCKA
jgi:hypothetical protein